MTDQEFVNEVRRGLITIMRAIIRRYGLSWKDFMPREEPCVFTPRPEITLPLAPAVKSGV